MGACGKDLFDVVFFLECSADNALTATVLRLEGINRQALDIAFAAERNHLFFFGNQVFVIVVIDSVFDRGTAIVAALVHDGVETVEHNLHAAFALFQNILQVGNGSNEFVVFSFQLFDIQAGELSETHVHDSLRLDFVEVKAVLQRGLRGFGRRARLDNLHHFVDVLRCNAQAFDNVETSFGLVQVKLRRTRDHFQAVIHVNLDKVLQRQELRQVIDESQIVNAEGCLQLRVFEQIIQNNFGSPILQSSYRVRPC